MKKAVIIAGIILVLLLVLVVWLLSRSVPTNQQVYRKCDSVEIGSSYDDVVATMGDPNTETQSEGRQ